MLLTLEVDAILSSTVGLAVCEGNLRHTGVAVRARVGEAVAKRIAEDLRLQPYAVVQLPAADVYLPAGEPLPDNLRESEFAEGAVIGGAVRILQQMRDTGQMPGYQPRGNSPMDRYRDWRDYRAPRWAGDALRWADDRIDWKGMGQWLLGIALFVMIPAALFAACNPGSMPR